MTRSATRLLLPLLVLTASCGPEKDSPQSSEDTSCKAGIAQIAIHDGFVENLCGCTEPRATALTTTCSVATGTAVIFIYPLTRLRHQVISTGSPSFPSSAVSDPEQDLRIFSHAVIFTTAGTYAFGDAYNPILSGQIVVF